MRAFDTLTEQELVALSEEDIQRYIDYACAENGVPLLPALIPEPPSNPVPETDEIAYAVGRSYSTDIVCLKSSDAQELADFLNRIQTVELQYVPGPTTDRVIDVRRGPYVVTPTPCYSAALGATIRPALADAERAKKVYDAAKKDYDRAVAEREGTASEIRDKVSDAWEVHNRRESRRRDFARYLQLADGKQDIAARFLLNAHHDSRELLPELYPVEAEVVAG